MGTILFPADRMVTAVLRVMGLSWEKHFQNYHRVLNRAVWPILDASRILLGLLISAFAIRRPVILGKEKLTEWARQMVLQARRWLPKRFLVVVADSSFAVFV